MPMVAISLDLGDSFPDGGGWRKLALKGWASLSQKLSRNNEVVSVRNAQKSPRCAGEQAPDAFGAKQPGLQRLLHRMPAINASRTSRRDPGQW